MIRFPWITHAAMRAGGLLAVTALALIAIAGTVTLAGSGTQPFPAGRVAMDTLTAAHGLAVPHTVHDGPYTYTPAVTAPAGDLVTFHGSMCRGATASASILAVTDNGGEESEPGAVRADHLSFRLEFGPSDDGSWNIVSVAVTCADGSYGQYDGVHPVITVTQPAS